MDELRSVEDGNYVQSQTTIEKRAALISGALSAFEDTNLCTYASVEVLHRLIDTMVHSVND
jgi:hypothetical protein